MNFLLPVYVLKFIVIRSNYIYSHTVMYVCALRSKPQHVSLFFCIFQLYVPIYFSFGWHLHYIYRYIHRVHTVWVVYSYMRCCYCCCCYCCCCDMHMYIHNIVFMYNKSWNQMVTFMMNAVIGVYTPLIFRHNVCAYTQVSQEVTLVHDEVDVGKGLYLDGARLTNQPKSVLFTCKYIHIFTAIS